MPAYGSQYNEVQARQVCGMSILPIKTKIKGPAPVEINAETEDIIDETLNYFRANMLFRNFEVRGPADRLLVYLTLYAHQCLTRLPGKDKDAAGKVLYQLAIENFPIPGDKNFVLGGLVQNPKDRAESELCRQLFTQLRHEVGLRLVERVYANDPSQPDKWWTCWTKRRFLNKSLDPAPGGR
eukprot:TRINITY_DN1010_c0_g2_i1.p1 TRINITY_DN1010_c0_g2~~TRINITY_DN1010_c0_g2_i1.p1  ORF type:complete len:213 (+),score=30.68 TRINITY_DN1010_c0_g2_i1:94-639(+)